MFCRRFGARYEDWLYCLCCLEGGGVWLLASPRGHPVPVILTHSMPQWISSRMCTLGILGEMLSRRLLGSCAFGTKTSVEPASVSCPCPTLEFFQHYSACVLANTRRKRKRWICSAGFLFCAQCLLSCVRTLEDSIWH